MKEKICKECGQAIIKKTEQEQLEHDLIDSVDPYGQQKAKCGFCGSDACPGC